MAMVLLAAIINIAEPIYEYFYGLVGLVKDEGKTIWTTLISELPFVDRIASITLSSLDSLAWLYVLLQIWRLARYYQNGHIFEERNALCFMRVGMGLCIMGFLQTAEYPVGAHYLYWRGISPWLADMPPIVFAIRADLLMAGVFFFVLGKIMRRAVELEETNRLIV